MAEAKVEDLGKHRVHFDADNLKDDLESGHSVTYDRCDDVIFIKLGFLQVNHRYRVDLKLPVSLFDKGTTFHPSLESSNCNPNCRISTFAGVNHPEQDYFEMQIEFFAYKENLLREMVSIVNAKDSKAVIKLMIIARALGKGKGTPLLRSGIHCLGEEDPEESESDVPRFDKGD
ncbi:adipose-secreted signaling protein [Bactrocera oleae]|uniref:adipose-secreted signaling protein n=1 Tax=Bactrocera oleae TaxID=104688 RepID=UPI0006B71D98|nr:UPF0687 protein C20orf27 homolog [Bactrocera oleae]XP_036226871.1 UPF0687 protein C20orf27 homolog [Bactrocera oleae]XP_036226872.1 UPF0687 protein C20orf27 homolog [Bactrocera oleae]XP_036226873.1 UPF0687 protein C20orf27 homolog [Bactrocera oleae]